VNITSIPAETDKIKFEHMLQKKVDGVQFFSKKLIE